MTGFLIGLAIGAVVVIKIVKDHNDEIKRINKSWMQEIEHKNDYIKSLEREIKRLCS